MRMTKVRRGPIRLMPAPDYKVVSLDDKYYLVDTLNGTVFDIDDLSVLLLLSTDGIINCADLTEQVASDIGSTGNIRDLVEETLSYLVATKILVRV